MPRPTGITILAIVDLLSGALSLVISGLALAMSGRLMAKDQGTDDRSSALMLNLSFRGNLVFWIGLIGAGISLFKLIAGIGLGTLKPWGRQLALVSGTINLLTDAFGVTQGAVTPAGVTGVLVNSAVLLYLFRPEVRQALADVTIDVPATAT